MIDKVLGAVLGFGAASTFSKDKYAKGGSTYAEGGEIFNDYFDIDKVKSIENVEVFTNQRKGHKNYVRVDYVPLSRPQTMQVEFRKIPFNTDEELNYIKKTLQDNFASTYAKGGFTYEYGDDLNSLIDKKFMFYGKEYMIIKVDDDPNNPIIAVDKKGSLVRFF